MLNLQALRSPVLSSQFYTAFQLFLHVVCFTSLHHFLMTLCHFPKSMNVQTNFRFWIYWIRVKNNLTARKCSHIIVFIIFIIFRASDLYPSLPSQVLKTSFELHNGLIMLTCLSPLLRWNWKFYILRRNWVIVNAGGTACIS